MLLNMLSLSPSCCTWSLSAAAHHLLVIQPVWFLSGCQLLSTVTVCKLVLVLPLTEWLHLRSSHCTQHPRSPHCLWLPFFLYNLQLSWLLCLFVLTFLPATDPGSSTEDFHKELWPSSYDFVSKNNFFLTQYLKKRITREQNFYIFLYFMSLATLTLSLISLLLPVREEIIVLYINYCVYYAEIILLLIIFLIY